jgi:hypothetical protein
MVDMSGSSKEIFISYAWGGNSEEFVDCLDQAFQEKGVAIIRDKRDLGYKGLIKEFMERIGRGKCVIAVINDKYLKSPNCMFELVQVSRNGKFYGRIFPIVLPDAQIYDPVQRLKYIKHWEDKKKELNEAIREVGAEYLQGIREEIDQYTQIRNTIAELTSIFKNMNTLTPDIHSQSGFEIVVKAIQDYFEITQQGENHQNLALGQHEDILDSTKNVDYSNLRDLLKVGRWKEADEETLKVMLKAANREDEGWLDVEDFNRFPCTDLRTIDQLWVKYSSGKFGFSAQKKIWQECVRPTEYRKEWEKFGDRVGWRAKRTWIEGTEVIFDLSAPEGHLPIRAGVWGRMSGLRCWVVFLRAGECAL